MTQFALLSPSTPIEISPGDVQMYRLPTMTPGDFHLYAHQTGVITQPLPGSPGGPALPGSPGVPGQPGQPITPAIRIAVGNGNSVFSGGLRIGPSLPVNPGGGGGGGGQSVVGLQMDLYHGDQHISSGVGILPLQYTPSDGDSTWRVQLQLAPDAPAGTYSFDIYLDPFPSMFPLLTRRIPLAFFQQGFDNNWKGRNYVTAEFDDGDLFIHFDPELASYYGMADVNYMVGSVTGLTFPNIQVSDISLSIDSSDGPYEGIPGPIPYILLTVKFTGVGGQPISGNFLHLDFSVSDFSINVKFFLTAMGPGLMNTVVGYVSQAGTDLMAKLDANCGIKHEAQNAVNDLISKAQQFFDGYALQVGAALTPWLLGAGFAVYGVSYDPSNSQPVPADGPQGDLVIQYIGQIPPPSSPGLTEAAPATTGSLPLVLGQSNFAAGVVGTAYSQAFAATGGVTPYTWIIGGTLPSGVTASGNTLSGTPTSPGIYNVAVTLKDAAGTQVSQTYAVAINTPALSIATNDPLPGGVITHPYAVPLAVTGAAGEYTWSANNLPAGLTMLPQGVIEGTATGTARNAAFTVQATDAHGVSAWKAFSVNLQDPPLFPDVIYAPRGDGDTIWKPPAPPPSFAQGAPPVLPQRTTPGNLSKVDHIVVVMMENRSFDHMLGYLSKEGGRTDIEGLRWESEENATQFNFYKGKYYYPTLLTDTHAISVEALSPDHSHESVKAQMADGMGHFVSDYAKLKAGDNPEQLKIAMGYYGAAQLPVYDKLARDYCVCDHWFCSHVGPTWPNRFVAMTGDLNRDSWGEPEVNTPDYTTFTPSEGTTIFDLLKSRDVTWKYFQQRASMMRAFTKYSFDLVDVLEYSDPDKGFHKMVGNGDLPSFTWVDPLFGDVPAGISSPQDNDDAPPSDLHFGQLFIQDVYNTLFTPKSNPKWDKTMLIIVYDEHGGFYDHVDPPTNATPLLGQNSGKLGPRVPAFVISPYTPAGLVLKDTFDHGTIGATVLRRFCSPNPPFMSARVSAAADLRDALPLAQARGELVASEAAFPSGLSAMAAQRTAVRRFKLPDAADSFGPSLGGLALTLGSTPGSKQ